MKQRRLLWLVVSAMVIVCPIILQSGRAKTANAALDNHRGNGRTNPNSSALTRSSLPTVYAAFTISTSRTMTRSDGQTRLVSMLQRFQRSDGTYKLVQTFYSTDGATERVQTQFGFMGLGVFRLDLLRRVLIFTGPQIDAAPTDIESYLRSQSFYTRDESVLGLSTIVWRKPGRTAADFVEEYRAPSLGGLLVKSLKASARGREVVEPITIQLGEPPSTLFSELVLYPANYSSYERRILEMERNGEPEVAGMMRRLLERMRQARP